jgi:uncharacterized protein (DUF427 family)
MTAKPAKVPGPDHPITIARNPRASSSPAISLPAREASYPAVQYVHRGDVHMSTIEPARVSAWSSLGDPSVQLFP